MAARPSSCGRMRLLDRCAWREHQPLTQVIPSAQLVNGLAASMPINILAFARRVSPERVTSCVRNCVRRHAFRGGIILGGWGWISATKRSKCPYSPDVRGLHTKRGALPASSLAIEIGERRVNAARGKARDKCPRAAVDTAALRARGHTRRQRGRGSARSRHASSSGRCCSP